MSKPLIWIFAAGLTVLLSSKLASAASKTQGLLDKIKFYPGIPKFTRYENGFFNFQLTVQVMNQSAFDLEIDNLWISIQYIDPITNKWQELVTQNAPVQAKSNSTHLPIAKHKLSILPVIPLSVPVSNAGVIADLILGKINPQLKVVTRFEFSGVELPAIEQMIDAKAMVAPVRSVLTSLHLLSGLETNQIERA